MDTVLKQLAALSVYIVFVGFCFCDGFRMHILRKLIWFAAVLVLSFYTLKIKDEFDLTLILPVTAVLAIILCIWEKRAKK